MYKNDKITNQKRKCIMYRIEQRYEIARFVLYVLEYIKHWICGKLWFIYNGKQQSTTTPQGKKTMETVQTTYKTNYEENEGFTKSNELR